LIKILKANADPDVANEEACKAFKINP